MNKLVVFGAAALFLASCGEKKAEKKEEGFEMSRTKQEAPAAQAPSDGVPVDLTNKGVGPVTSVTFGAEVDQALAAQGQVKFSTVCVACHHPTQRMIGPALKGVYERRSPEWVMNMILNPDGMIKEDPIAKALLKEYNGAIMLNQNFTEEEARAVAEYLRTL